MTGSVTNEQQLRAFFNAYAVGARVSTTNRDLAAQIGCAPSRLPGLLGKLEASGDIRRVSVGKGGSVFEIRRSTARLPLPGGEFRYAPAARRDTPRSSICTVLREWGAVAQPIRATNRLIAEAACCATGAVSPVLQALEADGAIQRTITTRYTDITLLRAEVLR